MDKQKSGFREWKQASNRKRVDQYRSAIRAFQNAEADETIRLMPAVEANLTVFDQGGFIRIAITKTPFIIGRGRRGTDYCVSYPQVSRLHAEIIFDHGRFFIKDLKSKNGTFLNGIRIVVEKFYSLSHGDIVILANREIIFEWKS